MSETVNVNLATVTPDGVKTAVDSFLLFARMMVKFIPGEKGETFTKILDAVENVNKSEWFQSLVAFLLNTFATKGEVSRNDFASALSLFAARTSSPETTPAFASVPLSSNEVA